MVLYLYCPEPEFWEQRVFTPIFCASQKLHIQEIESFVTETVIESTLLSMPKQKHLQISGAYP